MNYVLRVTGAAAVLVVFCFFLLDQGGNLKNGGDLFMGLHTAVVITIGVLVPMMTADCIARERREGTLGLLFLTPLQSREIVIGKSVVHMFRALTLLLCAFPILSVPLLMGGVAWLDIYTAFAFQFSVLLLALAAGLTASSMSKLAGRSMFAALLLCALFIMVYGWVLMLVFMTLYPGNRAMPPEAFIVGPPAILTLFADDTWSRVVPQMLGTGAAGTWPLLVAGATILSLAFLLIAIFNAGKRVAGSWQQEPPSRRQAWWFRTFCTPQYWTGLFRQKMRRALNRNPIGWLHQYSWSARLTKWGWCIAIVLFEGLIAGFGYSRDLVEVQFYVGLALLIGMALSAAGSFRRERETGALELILVTPLSVRQVIWGRLSAVYTQFAVAAGVLVCLWWYIDVPGMYYYNNDDRWLLWIVVSNFFLVPIVGLYFSIRTKTFIVAVIWTLFYTLVVPLVLCAGLMVFGLLVGVHAVFDWMEKGADEYVIFFTYLLSLAVAGMILVLLLQQNLTQRKFALAR